MFIQLERHELKISIPDIFFCLYSPAPFKQRFIVRGFCDFFVECATKILRREQSAEDPFVGIISRKSRRHRTGGSSMWNGWGGAPRIKDLSLVVDASVIVPYETLFAQFHLSSSELKKSTLILHLSFLVSLFFLDGCNTRASYML